MITCNYWSNGTLHMPNIHCIILSLQDDFAKFPSNFPHFVFNNSLWNVCWCYIQVPNYLGDLVVWTTEKLSCKGHPKIKTTLLKTATKLNLKHQLLWSDFLSAWLYNWNFKSSLPAHFTKPHILRAIFLLFISTLQDHLTIKVSFLQY